MGKSHVVIPSSNDEVALTDESLDQNTQSRYFHIVCVVQFPRQTIFNLYCNIHQMCSFSDAPDF